MVRRKKEKGRSGEEGPPAAQKTRAKERTERRKKAGVTAKSHRARKEESEDEAHPNPGGEASSSRGVGESTGPSYLRLTRVIRGTVGRHFEDTIPGRHRPPEPVEPPRARQEGSRHDYSREERAPRARSRSREKKSKGKKHFLRGIEKGYTPWRKEQWRRR